MDYNNDQPPAERDVVSTTTAEESSVNLPPPGGLSRLLIKWLFRTSKISRVEVLSRHYRRITLAGEELKSVAWTPGQKIQINVGGNDNRTYTPIDWDQGSGETRILPYRHGDGPGTRWASSVKVGDPCAFLGPRRSLDLGGRLAGQIFLVGDETTFGLALSMIAHAALLGPTALLFEVSSVEEASSVWRTCSEIPAHFVLKSAPCDPLDPKVSALIEQSKADFFILSGRAQSIQRIRRLLRARGVPSKCIVTKAYWAPGKAGLD